MGKLAKFGDLYWEAITLKHVSKKEIVVPYLLFVLIALIFEVFLAVLFTISSFIFYSYRFSPSLGYYISGAALTLLLIKTIFILKKVISKYKLSSVTRGAS